MPLAQTDWREPAWIGADRDWPIRQAVTTSLVFALVLGTFLVSRRLSGALDVALPPGQLVAAAVLLLAWAVAVRAVERRRLAVWLLAIVLLLFAVACSYPGERAVDWFAWLSVFGAYVASHNAIAAHPARRSSPAMDAEKVLQQLTRSRTAVGNDVVHGTLVAEFAPGERTATLYVAFCPPFERLPRVELESSADARLVQTLHNGAQIEVRLPRAAATPTSVAVELYTTDAE